MNINTHMKGVCFLPAVVHLPGLEIDVKKKYYVNRPWPSRHDILSKFLRKLTYIPITLHVDLWTNFLSLVCHIGYYAKVLIKLVYVYKHGVVHVTVIWKQHFFQLFDCRRLVELLIELLHTWNVFCRFVTSVFWWSENSLKQIILLAIYTSRIVGMAVHNYMHNK